MLPEGYLDRAGQTLTGICELHLLQRKVASMKRAALLAALLLAVPFTGCAFGNRDLNLTYPPNTRGAAAQSSPTEPLPTVILIDFLEQRTEKAAVGAIHNGFGAHTADAITKSNVADWVMNAVTLELQGAGFKVIRAHSVPKYSENSIITGEVLTVYCNMYTKYEGSVSFSVTVRYQGQELLHKTYDGKITYKSHSTKFGPQFAEALSQSLEGAAKAFTAELSRDLPAATINPGLTSAPSTSFVPLGGK
jgi:hypothetical protein